MKLCSYSQSTERTIISELLKVQRHILGQVTADAPFSEIFIRLINRIKTQTGIVIPAVVFLWSAKEERLYEAALVNMQNGSVRNGNFLGIPLRKGRRGASAFDCHLQLVKDIAVDLVSPQIQRLRQQGLSGYWPLPLHDSHDRFLGSLICFFANEHALTAEEANAIEIVAQTLVLILERQDLRRQLNSAVIKQNKEAAMWESDRLWRNSIDLLLIISQDGVICSVNPAFTTTLGYEPNEMVGKDFQPFVHSDDIDATFSAIAKALQRPLENFKIRVRHKDGSFRWFAWQASSEEGTVYANGRDITGEVVAAEKLAELAEENSALIENSLDIIALFDHEGRCLRINNAVKEVVGYEPGELIGRSYVDLVAPNELLKTTAADAVGRRMRSSLQDFENAWVHKDGSLVRLSWSVRYSKDGTLMYATGRNITERYRIQVELQKSKDRLSNMLESMADAFFAVDNDWRITYVNKKTADFVSRRREDLVGKIVWEAVPELLTSAVFPHYQKAMETRDRMFLETFWEPNQAWVEVRIYPSEDGLSVFFHDITERRETENAIRRSEQRFREIIEMTPAGYTVIDSQAVILEANPALCKISGYSREELIGASFAKLFLTNPFDNALRMKEGIHWAHSHEDKLRHRDGHIAHVVINANIKHDIESNSLSLTAFMTDITERKQAEERLEQIATHDALTGLPNRTFLNIRLQQILDTVSQNEAVALMFIDLDRFKEVNDTMGHSPGDTLLRAVACRLQRILCPNDIIARLGGDEFIVAAHCSKREESAVVIAGKLLSSLKAPFVIEDQEVLVSASIGISMFPQDGTSKEELFKNADIAMYRAKAAGRNAYRFFEAEMSEAARVRRVLENSFHRALAGQEFELYYQLRIDLKSMVTVGLEALIRWNHPELGRVSPLQFIPIAEETGFIEVLGEWVLREACRQARRLNDILGSSLRISVNLSARQLKDQNLVNTVKAVLSESALPGHLLELELTETALMEDMDLSASILKELKNLGIRLAVDDFGTGYSGLAYLQRFPLDVLKLDRTFVSENAEDAKNLNFIKAFLDLAHALDLSVVAEGIETEDIVELLCKFSCDEGQGYFFAKPLPLNEVELFLSTSVLNKEHERIGQERERLQSNGG